MAKQPTTSTPPAETQNGTEPATTQRRRKALKPVKLVTNTEKVTRKLSARTSKAGVTKKKAEPATKAGTNNTKTAPAKAPAKEKENIPEIWAKISGGGQMAGLVDDNQDTYRVKLTAVSSDGAQYQGTVLHNAKKITINKGDLAADPGMNKITKADREAAAKRVIQRGQMRQQAALAAAPRPVPVNSSGTRYKIPRLKPTTATPATSIPANNPLLLPGLSGGTADITNTALNTFANSTADNLGMTGDELYETDEESNDAVEESNPTTGSAPTEPARTSITTNPNIMLTTEQFQALINMNNNRPTNGNQDNDNMATYFTQQQQFFQTMSSDNRAIVEAIMNKKSDTDVEKEAAKQRTVDSYETEIPEMIDDMETNLSAARFLPMSTNLKYSQTLVPIKTKPVRTNYTFTEFGMNINKFAAVTNCHDRQYPSLQLKMFRHDNLARVDQKTRVQIDGKDLSVKDADQNLANKWQAILALLNFHVITTQICPANTETLTLLCAVLNYTLGGYGDPTSGDISDLFVRWTLLRAENVGKDTPITYKTVYDTLKEIVQNRTDKVNSLLTTAANAQKEVKVLTKETHNNHRGGGTGHRGGRGGGKAGGHNTFKKRQMQYNKPNQIPNKKPRTSGPQLCRAYNGPGGCTRAPGADKCVVASGELIHACNFLQPSGIQCGQAHPRNGNH